MNMNELIEELKSIFSLRHVLYLTNGGFFVVVSFINWDLFWWWNIGDWNAFDRIMFLLIIGVVNFFAVMAYNDSKEEE